MICLFFCFYYTDSDNVVSTLSDVSCDKNDQKLEDDVYICNL